jgi:chromosomal replication initiation ATPase DnaA
MCRDARELQVIVHLDLLHGDEHAVVPDSPSAMASGSSTTFRPDRFDDFKHYYHSLDMLLIDATWCELDKLLAYTRCCGKDISIDIIRPR